MVEQWPFNSTFLGPHRLGRYRKRLHAVSVFLMASCSLLKLSHFPLSVLLLAGFQQPQRWV